MGCCGSHQDIEIRVDLKEAPEERVALLEVKEGNGSSEKKGN